MERHLLFVDDQWCRPGDQATIRAAFGELQRRTPPYRFHYETAETTAGCYSAQPVLARLDALPGVSAIILDILFGDDGCPVGLEILAEVRARYPLLPVIIMTTVDRDISTLERAMALGATEYLVKTPTLRQIERVLATYVEEQGEQADYAIWGNSGPMRTMRAEIARVAAGGVRRVLIVGESGVGKELVARAIHGQGMKRGGPFIAKNCAYASTELLDSELFGHERGAFTGADRPHVGLLEAADNGVLFLDEISSMPHDLQGKLLRTLEMGTFERLGSRDVRASDFDLVSATNLEPAELVESGRLREDLYYRISEYTIRVPPLHERADDVEVLATLFLNRLRGRRANLQPGAFPAERFATDALEALRTYRWPGNVRQLRNVVSEASLRARGVEIGVDSLPEHLSAALRHAATAATKNGSQPATETQTAPEIAITSSAAPPDTGPEPSAWPMIRLRQELELAVAAKERIVQYKGRQWKAEFMRLMYPECRAQSAKGFNDLIRRLTQSPWGSPELERQPELKALLDRLQA